MLLLAETSAVQSTQTTVTAQLRGHSYRLFWSPPVQSHYSAPGRPVSRRGHALGAAVITSAPAFAPFDPLPSELLDTQRVAESCVRIGALTFLALSVYGFHASRPQAAELNQSLFSAVLQRVGTSRLPALIGGDFNCAVENLPVWRSFRDLGYVELHALFRSVTGKSLPSTCKGATAWDSLILRCLPRSCRRLGSTLAVCPLMPMIRLWENLGLNEA